MFWGSWKVLEKSWNFCKPESGSPEYISIHRGIVVGSIVSLTVVLAEAVLKAVFVRQVMTLWWYVCVVGGDVVVPCSRDPARQQVLFNTC